MGPSISAPVTVQVKDTVNVVKVGVNYLFNVGPVVAKY
jgi:hypothetical protein